MKRSLVLFLAVFTLVFTITVTAYSAIPSVAKTQILKDFAEWQSDIDDFEDLTETETQVKRDWLFRLQFLIERRYDGNENSILRILKFMVELDSKQQNSKKNTETLLTERLIEALEKSREPNEPLWAFVKAYVDDVNPLDPPTLDQFTKSRDYINRFQGIAAKRISPEDLEILLEKLERPPAQK